MTNCFPAAVFALGILTSALSGAGSNRKGRFDSGSLVEVW